MHRRRSTKFSHSPTHLLTHSLRGTTIGFIGAGTMGQALMQGLRAQGVPASRILASETNSQRRRDVSQRLKIQVSPDTSSLVREASVLVLAVKPQQLSEVVSELALRITPRHLVISIAAGITLRWLQLRLRGVPIIRVMPNLPATVGAGFSTISLGRYATARHRAIAKTLFGAVGEVCELPERYFDAITAVSGSGPAYIFFVIQAWEEAARRLGLPSPVAAQAIRCTLEGSTRLLRASEDSAAALIQRVASKGGTTEAALKVLKRRGAGLALIEAVRAAATRSRALSWM